MAGLDISQVRTEVINVLSDPYSIPSEFQTWLRNFLSRGDSIIPYNSIVGLPAAGPYASMGGAATQSIPTGSWTTTDFDTEDFDIPGGMINLTGNQMIITSPGIWLIGGHLQWAAGTGTQRAMGFSINGETTPVAHRSQELLKPTGDSIGMNNTVFITDRMTDGDLVTLLAFQNSGANLGVTNARLRACYLGNIISLR